MQKLIFLFQGWAQLEMMMASCNILIRWLIFLECWKWFWIENESKDYSLCRQTRRSSIGYSSNTCTEVPKGWVTPTTGTDSTHIYLAGFFYYLQLQRDVENGGRSYDTTGLWNLLYCSLWMSLIYFSLQRMRDITRTQLCTKEVWKLNPSLKSFFLRQVLLVQTKGVYP